MRALESLFQPFVRRASLIGSMIGESMRHCKTVILNTMADPNSARSCMFIDRTDRGGSLRQE